jgi:hypothetical protein
MKKIIIESKSVPDKLGYNDKCTIIDTNNGIILTSIPCSCCPNPYKSTTHESWEKVYGWIDFGEYNYECWTSPKHNKCLMLNNMGFVNTRNPNINHNNHNIANCVEFHEGQNDVWRGSACCLTIAPLVFPGFIGMFSIGEKGKLVIIDAIKDPVA